MGQHSDSLEETKEGGDIAVLEGEEVDTFVEMPALESDVEGGEVAANVQHGSADDGRIQPRKFRCAQCKRKVFHQAVWESAEVEPCSASTKAKGRLGSRKRCRRPAKRDEQTEAQEDQQRG